MENHSAGSYEHDYPFTVTYVDEKNKQLVVGMPDSSRILTKMIIAHYDSMGGDSGAPVIITENNTNTLVGIHKGYVCQFTDSDGLSINVRHDVRFCVDANNNGSNYYKVFTPWETVKSELRLR